MTTPEFIALIAAGMSSAGVFGVRAFLPAFLAAVSLRLGQEGWLPLGIFEHIKGSAPTWFTCDIALVVWGVLAAAEILGRKIAEVHEVMEDAAPYAKSAVAFVAFLASRQVVDLSPETVEILKTMPLQAGFWGFAIVPALFAASGTFVLAHALRSLRGYLHLDDDTHRLFSWMGDLWVVFGVLLILLVPLLALGVGLAIGAGILLLKRLLERAERRALRACAACGRAKVRPCALECPGCRVAVAEPCDIGLLGRPAGRPVADRASFPIKLALACRCPRCATPLARGATPECPACGARPFADPDFSARYAKAVSMRLCWVLPVCALAGMVPVAGIVVAVVLSRMMLVQPLAIRVPLARRWITRWGLRFLMLLLGVLQMVPVAGAVPAVAMVLVSHSVWRRSFFAVDRQ